MRKVQMKTNLWETL